MLNPKSVPAEEIGVRDNVRPHGSEFLRRIRLQPVAFHPFTQRLKSLIETLWFYKPCTVDSGQPPHDPESVATTSSPTYSRERVTLARAWCGLTMRPTAAVTIARRERGDRRFIRPPYRKPRVSVNGRTYQKSGISRQNPFFFAARPLSGSPDPGNTSHCRALLPPLAQPRRAPLETGFLVGRGSREGKSLPPGGHPRGGGTVKVAVGDLGRISGEWVRAFGDRWGGGKCG